MLGEEGGCTVSIRLDGANEICKLDVREVVIDPLSVEALRMLNETTDLRVLNMDPLLDVYLANAPDSHRSTIAQHRESVLCAIGRNNFGTPIEHQVMNAAIERAAVAFRRWLCDRNRRRYQYMAARHISHYVCAARLTDPCAFPAAFALMCVPVRLTERAFRYTYNGCKTLAAFVYVFRGIECGVPIIECSRSDCRKKKGKRKRKEWHHYGMCVRLWETMNAFSVEAKPHTAFSITRLEKRQRTAMAHDPTILSISQFFDLHFVPWVRHNCDMAFQSVFSKYCEEGRDLTFVKAAVAFSLVEYDLAKEIMLMDGENTSLHIVMNA